MYMHVTKTGSAVTQVMFNLHVQYSKHAIHVNLIKVCNERKRIAML